MKILIVCGSEEEIATVKGLWIQNGWAFRVASRMGRPRSNYPVRNVLDTFRKVGTIRGVSRKLGISAPTVSRILKEAGVQGSDSGVLAQPKRVHVRKEVFL